MYNRVHKHCKYIGGLFICIGSCLYVLLGSFYVLGAVYMYWRGVKMSWGLFIWIGRLFGCIGGCLYVLVGSSHVLRDCLDTLEDCLDVLVSSSDVLVGSLDILGAAYMYWWAVKMY